MIIAALTTAAALVSCSDDQPDPTAPELSTAEVSDVTQTTAKISSGIVSDGNGTITDVGVIYGKEAGVTLENGTKKSIDGNQEGDFSVTLDGLDDWETYYAKPYAVNEAGVSYGDEVSFETPPKAVRTVNVNGVELKMVFVEGGTFTMGAMEGDAKAKSYETPVHKVTLDSYYIGMYEVTNELWNTVIDGNASSLPDDERLTPVVQKNWDESNEFTSKLSELTGMKFCLPTEAQWEYAARGGNKSKGYLYSGGNEIDPVAWYTSNTPSFQVTTVGTKQSNELGLYDMTGNANEWCQDWYYLYTADEQVNPVCEVVNEYGFHVMRGASFINDDTLSRVTHRFGGSGRMFFVGFRLALTK